MERNWDPQASDVAKIQATVWAHLPSAWESSRIEDEFSDPPLSQLSWCPMEHRPAFLTKLCLNLWIHELKCVFGCYVLSGLSCSHRQTRRSSFLLSRPIFSTAFCTWMSPGHFRLNVFREFYFHFEHRSEHRNPPRRVTSILIMQTTQINYKIMTFFEPIRELSS